MFEVPKTNQVSNVEFHLKPFKCTGSSQKLTSDYHFKYSPEKSHLIGWSHKNQENELLLGRWVELPMLNPKGEWLRNSLYEGRKYKEILTETDSIILRKIC